MNCCGVLFLCDCTLNFEESVMTVMLTHGWPLCMFPGFESPRNRFWLNGIISQSVRLSPCEQDPEEEGVSFRLQKSRPCAQSSVAVRITPPPFFFSTVYRCCCCCSFYHFLPIAATPRTLRSIHRDSIIIATKRFGTGDLQTELSTDLQRQTHTAWTKNIRFSSVLEFTRAN
jgi:hypothetical protein